jgi:hypothetical protein
MIRKLQKIKMRAKHPIIPLKFENRPASTIAALEPPPEVVSLSVGHVGWRATTPATHEVASKPP